MKVKSDAYKILATSGLLLTDAMVYHEILTSKYSHIATLSEIKSKQNIKKSLEENWDKILIEDYEPIFKTALNIIKTLPSSHNTNVALKDLIDIANDIATSPILLKHDLFGRIYHTLLLGKLVKYYATLYTSLPAARLLATLVLDLSQIDFKAPLTINNEPLRAVDFACGSGTLLSAIYKVAEIKYRLENENPDMGAFHKYLVEEGLWGFDVLQHATHLTMTTLSLHNTYPIESSRIYTLKLGTESRQRKYMGSIDFLNYPYLRSSELMGGGKVGPIRLSTTKEEIQGVKIPQFHICIMNPPFTRSLGGNLLFGGLPSSERHELQKGLSELLSEKKLSGIGQAGLAAIFMFIADKYLLKNGQLGVVIPRNILSGTSYKKVREKLLNDYFIEYIITSYEGTDSNWNFSENTDLSEVLIVAKKKDDEIETNTNDKYTIFVNLWKKPNNEIEAISIGSQLLETKQNKKLFDISNSNASIASVRMWGKKIGEVYSVIIDENEFGNLSFFAQAELNRIVSLLRKGILYIPKDGIVSQFSLCAFSKVVEDIGFDCRSTHKVFKEDKNGIYKGFWNHESDVVTSIAQKPNIALAPKDVDDAKRRWKKSSKILVTDRIWLSKNRTLSILVSDDVVSNTWWNIIPKNEDDAKILTLWLNSTYGFLLLISTVGVTRGPWVRTDKGERDDEDGLWGVPVINLNKLKKSQKKKFVELYDKVSNKELKSFPEEFSKPKLRKEIDDGVNKILGIKADLSDIYKMLSRDPMITGSNLS